MQCAIAKSIKIKNFKKKFIYLRYYFLIYPRLIDDVFDVNL